MDCEIAPEAGTSPTGWWIAGLLERHVGTDGSIRYWNNLRIFRATTWREAFRKASAQGSSENETGAPVFAESSFLGITNLAPIYDEFEDGAELLFEKWHCPPETDEPPLGVFTEEELESEFEPHHSRP